MFDASSSKSCMSALSPAQTMNVHQYFGPSREYGVGVGVVAVAVVAVVVLVVVVAFNA